MPLLGITLSLRLRLRYTLCVICIAWTDHIKAVDLRTGCHMHYATPQGEMRSGRKGILPNYKIGMEEIHEQRCF